MSQWSDYPVLCGSRSKDSGFYAKNTGRRLEGYNKIHVFNLAAMPRKTEKEERWNREDQIGGCGHCLCKTLVAWTRVGVKQREAVRFGFTSLRFPPFYNMPLNF